MTILVHLWDKVHRGMVDRLACDGNSGTLLESMMSLQNEQQLQVRSSIDILHGSLLRKPSKRNSQHYNKNSLTA